MTKRGKGQPKKRNTVRSDEPSPRDLEIYRELCRGRTLRDVGEEFDLHHSTVIDIREKAARYLAPKYEKEIKGIKVSQTSALESLFEDCMDSWRRSRRGDGVETKDGENGYTKTMPLGDVAYADRAMKALADIRKIWGVEKHFELEGQSQLNPAGMDRDEYRLKVAQAQLNEAREMVKELKSKGVASG